MKHLPHHYHVVADASPSADVTLATGQLPALKSAAPIEFDGPGNLWSPETLLVAAVADCFILTFRAISKASHLDWQKIDCAVTGTLDHQDGKTRFTCFDIVATLSIADEKLRKKAEQTLAAAEKHCLVTASLSASTHLNSTVIING